MIRMSIDEFIARKVCTLAVYVLVSYISYHIGKYVMKKEIRTEEKSSKK